MTTSTQLNPYNLYWAIIYKGTKLVSKDWFTTKEKAEASKVKASEKLIVITDAQFGKCVIDHLGCKHDTPLNTLHLNDGDSIWSIPVTTKQLNND